MPESQSLPEGIKRFRPTLKMGGGGVGQLGRPERAAMKQDDQGGYILSSDLPAIEQAVREEEREKRVELERDRDRWQGEAKRATDLAERAVKIADQARSDERSKVLGKLAAQLQKWARTKRAETRTVIGEAEKLKTEWVAKGYDGAADLLIRAMDSHTLTEPEGLMREARTYDSEEGHDDGAVTEAEALGAAPPNVLTLDEAHAMVSAAFTEDHDTDVLTAALKRLGDWVDRELGLADQTESEGER